MLTVSLLKLLHILIFVYWLGGDLGAFISSLILIDGRRSLDSRLAALQIMNNVDMAPKTAMILTVPTGLSLAVHMGWIRPPAALSSGVWLVAIGWLALVWHIHLKHLSRHALARRIDIWMRCVAASMFAVLGLAIVSAHFMNLPRFIGFKFLIMAVVILAGLIVRGVLEPLFAAVRESVAAGPTPENDRIIRKVILWRSKPIVVFIWILITVATLLGIMTPI